MSDFWDEKEIIGSIEKNKREVIMISKCKRKDKQYLDIRIHTKTNSSGDTYLHTPKGINLELDKKNELIDLLNQM